LVRKNFDEASEVGKPPASQYRAKLMHQHGNPNRQLGKISPRKAAMQIAAGSSDDLAARACGEALGGALYLICSL
jgi:hypothetical protein